MTSTMLVVMVALGGTVMLFITGAGRLAVDRMLSRK